jgi:hypothetical protein
VTGLTSPGERKLTKQRFSFAEVQRMTCLNSRDGNVRVADTRGIWILGRFFIRVWYLYLT